MKIKFYLWEDFNQLELFEGLKKFKKLKYFDKFQKIILLFLKVIIMIS